MRMRFWNSPHRASLTLMCLTLLMLLSAQPALSQPSQLSQPSGSSCKVLDPELQLRHTGACVNGLADGTGTATGSARYSGGFKAGKKQGKGIKFWPATGDRYEGEFSEDRKEGNGTYVWGAHSASPGETYAGAYLDDLRHGPGTYQWSTNDRYSGPWAYDQAIGPATPLMRARARAYIETKVAVARPGIKVCREMRVGIATRERIQGTVISAGEDSFQVRIDDAGQMGHTLRGTDIRKGTLIQDDFPQWTPC